MICLKFTPAIVLLLCISAALSAAQTADEIMAQVAKNQDASATARANYVYHQNLLVRMKRSNGKLAREEVRDYTVTPTKDGVKRELIQVSGKIEKGKQLVTYDKSDFRYKGMDVDGDLVQSFADDFGVDDKSKDGLDHDLFPLRSEAIKGYRFTLVGTEKWKDRDVYHVTFEPVKGKDFDENWAGDVLVDKTEYQPVMVTSHLAWKVPVLVKTLLAFNLQQLGFKVTYQKFEDGVWFPVSYGGEFKFHFFFYSRTVGMGLINSDFKRAQVDTAIKYEAPEE
jgi:hypothetical protein